MFVSHYPIKEHTTNDQWHCQHRSHTRNRMNELILISIRFQDVRISHEAGPHEMTRFFRNVKIKLMRMQCFLKTFSCFHKYLVKSFMCSRLPRLLNPSSIAFLRVVWTWFLWAGMHVITHHCNHAHSKKDTVNAIIEKIFPATKISRVICENFYEL